MKTRMSSVFVALLITSASQGAWIAMGGGTPWEYELPAVPEGGSIAIVANPTDNNNTTFSITATLVNKDPVKIRFRTTDTVNGETERFFWLNMNITNQTNRAWGGFTTDIRDLLEPTVLPATNLHPRWAHFHYHQMTNPGAFSYYGCASSEPAGSPGEAVNQLLFADGSIANGARWNVTNIRVHDRPTVGATGPMEFELILTPYNTPAPGALALLAAAGLIPRRRRA